MGTIVRRSSLPHRWEACTRSGWHDAQGRIVEPVRRYAGTAWARTSGSPSTTASDDRLAEGPARRPTRTRRPTCSSFANASTTRERRRPSDRLCAQCPSFSPNVINREFVDSGFPPITKAALPPRSSRSSKQHRFRMLQTHGTSQLRVGLEIGSRVATPDQQSASEG